MPRAEPVPRSADQTRCPVRHCGGALWRPGDGADRMAEHDHAVVLQCNNNASHRWRVPVKGQQDGGQTG